MIYIYIYMFWMALDFAIFVVSLDVKSTVTDSFSDGQGHQMPEKFFSGEWWRGNEHGGLVPCLVHRRKRGPCHELAAFATLCRKRARVGRFDHSFAGVFCFCFSGAQSILLE